jgi:hypothetical protein
MWKKSGLVADKNKKSEELRQIMKKRGVRSKV